MNFDGWLKLLTENHSLRNYGLLPKAQCADGFRVSIQADGGKYCDPKESLPDLTLYTAFELGYPSADDPIIAPYRESEGSEIYGFVPKLTVAQLIDFHGGIVPLSISVEIKGPTGLVLRVDTNAPLYSAALNVASDLQCSADTACLALHGYYLKQCDRSIFGGLQDHSWLGHVVVCIKAGQMKLQGEELIEVQSSCWLPND